MKERTGAKCGALTKTATYCLQMAGLRTNHPGVGKCFLHGGVSKGAPSGNKNALVSGEYETLHVSALPEEQADLHARLDAAPVAQAEGAVRLASIREHRILLRIQDAIVSDDGTGMGITKVDQHFGWNVKGRVDFKDITSESILSTVMHLEEALSRVQALKLKAIELLGRQLKENPPTSGRLDGIVAAIDRSVAIHVAQEQGAAPQALPPPAETSP